MTTASDSKLSARFFLGLVALFLGELRDGLTMINMQSAFLIVSKSYTEKQADQNKTCLKSKSSFPETNAMNYFSPLLRFFSPEVA